MDLKLKGKSAIVTGGSAGIGLAIASALVEEGVHVLIVGRDIERLSNAREKLEVKRQGVNQQIATFSCDIADSESAVKLRSEALTIFSRIDILVNSAGASRAGAFFDLTDEVYYDALQLKFFGAVRVTREIAKHMVEHRAGRIVNIIGTGGRTPSATFLPGSTTNAALLNFTKGLSKALAPYQILVNAISPGVTATERADRLAKQNAEAKGTTVEEERAFVRSSIPLGDLVDPQDIANMTLLLVSDRMKSITGSEIIIDGGTQPNM